MVEYAEYLRGTKTLTSGTYAEYEIPTPVGRSTNEIIALHGFQLEHVTTAWAASKYFEWALSKNSGASTTQNISNSNVLDGGKQMSSATLSTGENGHMIEKKYYPPILCANNKLYLGLKTDLGNEVCNFRLCYTIRRVSRAELLEALVD